MGHPFEAYIKNIPDFPKKGIIFKDISPLLKENFNQVITEMGKNIPWDKIDYVVGIEARGFILGSALAEKFKKGFIPVRKKGKLPPPVMQQEYVLEYGTDILEMQLNDKKASVLVVDDVLATGGTLKAVMQLCTKNNYQVEAHCLLINLKFLNNFSEEGIPVFSVLEYN